MRRSLHAMPEENVSTVRTVSVSAPRVFAMSADPMAHSAIDGTGWVHLAELVTSIPRA